jgi:hypothetical protein
MLAYSIFLAAALFDHSAWDAVLKKHVSEIGEVDYSAIKSGGAELKAYVEALAESSPENKPEMFPTREHKLAYWLNSYNALVTSSVAKAYPAKSVRDLGFLFGFFRRADHTVGGRKMSLDDIEHGTIRKQFGDPRIHFAVVCASISCPRLSRDAFTGERVHEQLDAAARRFFGERRSLLIDSKRNLVTLSKLLDWYRADFEAAGGVLTFVRKYAPEPKAFPGSPSIRYFSYDWSINDPGSRAKAKSPLERELASGASKSP